MRPSQPATAPVPLMTKLELARYLRRSPRWIDDQVLLGMPFHQVGHGKRFDRLAALEWLDKGGRADAA